MNTKLKLQARIMYLSLRKTGFRSLLALGAVGLGIAAMMIMLALSAGARKELEAITDRIGKNLFMITAGQMLSASRGQGWFKSTRLNRTDVAAMREQIPEINTIVPILEGSLQVKLNREELTTTIRGASPELVAVRNFQLDDGRLFDEQDNQAQSRVAVVGSFVASRLNDGFTMVGETVWIGGIPFQVVGQLKEKGYSSDGQNEDDQILIPLETARRRVFNVDYLSRLLVQVKEQGAMGTVEEQARDVLRRTHELDQDVRDDFDILTLIRANEIRRMNSAFLEGLSQLFVAITLAIGGAGVLAVTFLNVKDRTSEIGLRMSVGARRRDIANLFVAEACVLSVLGGLAGLLIGLASIGVLKLALGWQMAVDLRGVAIPLLVSVLLGLVFGVFPAIKASRVMPVEALRDA
jgi:putative ABC transport system permease protein